MQFSPPCSVMVQTALASVALAAVSLVPANQGAMLLVPIVADHAAAIRIATANGARLLGRGPGGTLLVWADARAPRPLAAAGILAVAAPFAACGAGPA
jgi:hypothetical protein